MKHLLTIISFLTSLICAAQSQVTVSGSLYHGPEGEHTVIFNFDGIEPVSFERSIASGGYVEQFDVPDGWTGGNIFIEGCEDQILSNLPFSADTISGNEIYAYLWHCESTNFGCTDPEAYNYDPEANWEDGSCYYPECSENILFIKTQSWFYPSDFGWTIRNEDDEILYGSYVGNQDILADGITYETHLCIDDGCHYFRLEGSIFNGTIDHVFLSLDGQVLFDGSPQDMTMVEYGFTTYHVHGFGVNMDEPCPPPTSYGCTDPDAINYDPIATDDDGSCVYPNECVSELDVYSVPGNCDEFTVQAVWVGTSTSGAWTLGDQLLEEDAGNVSFELDEAGTYTLCYLQNEFTCPGSEEICVDLTVTEECLIGCADSLNLFTNDTSCTVSGVLYGNNIEDLITWDFGEGSDYLIDRNYMTHPYEGPGEYEVCATVNNDACPQSFCDTISIDCQYDWNCSVELSVEVSEDEPNTVLVTYDHSSGAVYGHFWIFGDGNVSTSSTPTHFYADEGPYTLCLNLKMWDDNFVPCMDQACVELSAEILESGFLGEGGFTLEVVAGGILSTQGSVEPTETVVYPNPAQSVIQFDLGHDQVEMISIYDASGRVIKLIQSYTSKQLIAIDDLKDGLYFIIDSDGNSQKFVIAR